MEGEFNLRMNVNEQMFSLFGSEFDNNVGECNSSTPQRSYITEENFVPEKNFPVAVPSNTKSVNSCNLPQDLQKRKSKQRCKAVQMTNGQKKTTEETVPSSSDQCTDFQKNLLSATEELNKLMNEKNHYEKNLLCTLEVQNEYKNKAHDYEIKINKMTRKIQEEIENREEILARDKQMANESVDVKKVLEEVEAILEDFNAIFQIHENRKVEIDSEGSKLKVENEDIRSKYCAKLEGLKAKCHNDEESQQEKLMSITKCLEDQLEDVNSKVSAAKECKLYLEKDFKKVQLEEKEKTVKLDMLKQHLNEKVTNLGDNYAILEQEKDDFKEENTALKITESMHNDMKRNFEKMVENMKIRQSELQKLGGGRERLEKKVSDATERTKILRGDLDHVLKSSSTLEESCAETNAYFKGIADSEKLADTCTHLKETLRNLSEEILQLKLQCNGFSSEQERCSVQKEELTKWEAELKQKKAGAESCMEMLRGEAGRLEQDGETLRKELEGKAACLAEMNTASAQMGEEDLQETLKMSGLEEQVRAARQQVCEAREKEKKCEKELKKTNIESATKQREMMQSLQLYRQQYVKQMKALEVNKEEVEAKSKKLEEELTTITREKNESDKKVAMLQEEKTSIENKISLQEKTNKKTDNDIKKAKKFKGKTSAKKEDAEELKQKIVELGNRKKSLMPVRKELETDKREKENLGSEIKNLAQFNKKLQEMCENRKKEKQKELQTRSLVHKNIQAASSLRNQRNRLRGQLRLDDDSSDCSSIDIPTFVNKKRPLFAAPCTAVRPSQLRRAPLTPLQQQTSQARFSSGQPSKDVKIVDPNNIFSL